MSEHLAIAYWKAGDRFAALVACGRNEALPFIRTRFGYAPAGPEDFDFVMQLWDGAEWPCRQMHRDEWIRWWRIVAPQRGQGDPVELWRGQARRRIGLSWTPDRSCAEWFCQRNKYFGFPDVRLLHGLAPPHSVLWSGINSRGESEAVVDPAVRFWRVESREEAR